MITLLLPALAYAGPDAATSEATPQEIHEKVVEAANFLSKAGIAGLAEFENPQGKFVWKNSYVWVTECKGIYCSLGPKSKLVGMGISKVKCYETGKFFILELCDKIENNPSGGWVEYWWPKSGMEKPQRKISFMMQVPGQPYQVVAGAFNKSTPVEDLSKISEKK